MPSRLSNESLDQLLIPFEPTPEQRARFAVFAGQMVKTLTRTLAVDRGPSNSQTRRAVAGHIDRVRRLREWADGRRSEWDAHGVPTSADGSWAFVRPPGASELDDAVEATLPQVVTAGFVAEVLEMPPPGWLGSDRPRPYGADTWIGQALHQDPIRVFVALLARVQTILVETEKKFAAATIVGGRSSDRIARWFLLNIAIQYDALGGRPTTAVTGRFRAFAEEVTAAMRLPTDWIDSQLRLAIQDYRQLKRKPDHNN